jgi:hypothetical protein
MSDRNAQTIFRVGHRHKPYSQLSNAMLRDKRMSYAQRGLLSFILSHPTDWKFNLAWLLRVGGVGKDSAYAAISPLNAWDRALRRDECGAWRINGTRGSIHTWGDGKSWVLYVACDSGQGWTWAKKRLVAFCEVTQDCDEEGCLRLHELPTPAQAAIIRDLLGIQKRREVSAAELERLRAFAFERRPRSEASI